MHILQSRNYSQKIKSKIFRQALELHIRYTLSLHKNCPNTEFFLVLIFCIQSEYEDLLHKSLYLVQIQENTDQKKLCIWALFT